MNMITQDFSDNVAPFGAEYVNVINGNYYYIHNSGRIKVVRGDSGWRDSLWSMDDFHKCIQLDFIRKLNVIGNLPREYRE